MSETKEMHCPGCGKDWQIRRSARGKEMTRWPQRVACYECDSRMLVLRLREAQTRERGRERE